MRYINPMQSQLAPSPTTPNPYPVLSWGSERSMDADLNQGSPDWGNLASWRRELPAGLGAHLVEWAKHAPERFDKIIALPGYDLSAATRGIASPARDWLTRDIAMLVARFADVANARRIRVAFGVIRTNQCPKFHVDYVHYRLVTTYVGPGTEWVPDHAVTRAALGRPVDCPTDANKDIVKDAAAVRHAVPGEVILMKGARHPDGQGAVHRSPPIEGTGQTRVVLTMSTA